MSIERFKALFDGFTRAHGRSKMTGEIRDRDKKNEAASRTVKGPLSDMAWQQHLAGTGDGVGVIPLRDDDTVKFSVIDVDKYDADLIAWAATLKPWPVVLCRSKSGGAHLYIFFKDPLPAVYTMEKMQTIKRHLGIEKSELFPKQVRRLSDVDSGNWINLPYYGDTRHAVHPDGHDMPLEEFLDYVEERFVTREKLDAIKEPKRKEPEPETGTEAAAYEGRAFVDAPGVMGDGPPCLTTCMEKVRLDPAYLDGNRSNYMINVATYLNKKHGLDAEWFDELMAINMLLPDPLTETELRTTCYTSVRRSDYQKYACNKEPIHAVCQRTTCWTRRFGIEPPESVRNRKKRATNLEAYNVKLDEVIMLKFDPPVWLVTIEDDNKQKVQMKMEAKDLLNLKAFSIAVLNGIQKVIVGIKNDQEFVELIKPHLEGARVQKVEDPFSIESLFSLHLRAFSSLQVTRDDVTLVESNRIYRYGDRIKFKSATLMRYLKQEGFNISDKELKELLHNKYNAKSETIEGKGNLITVVDILLPDQRTEDYRTPTIKEPFSQ